MEALTSWYEEKRSAYLYRIVANKERDPIRQKLFLDLAIAAEDQAAFWLERMKQNGETSLPVFKPDMRARVVGWFIHRFGPSRTRTILAAMKVRGMSVYLDDIPHHPMPRSISDIEKHHKTVSSGSNIRAAVFGVNDGLISNASLILGVSAATTDPHLVILSGIAGLLAGAFSMGSGEYVSVRSQRELFEYQIDLERKELELYPKEEVAELTLIYEARGFPHDEAARAANIIITNPEKALDTLAREELGLNPNDLGSPVGAAVSSFISFAVGAFIPLLPFFLAQSIEAVLGISILITGLSLFSVGALISLFTNSSALFGGIRMLLIGATAGSITYGIGALLGVALQ